MSFNFISKAAPTTLTSSNSAILHLPTLLEGDRQKLTQMFPKPDTSAAATTDAVGHGVAGNAKSDLIDLFEKFDVGKESHESEMSQSAEKGTDEIAESGRDVRDAVTNKLENDADTKDEAESQTLGESVAEPLIPEDENSPNVVSETETISPDSGNAPITETTHDTLPAPVEQETLPVELEETEHPTSPAEPLGSQSKPKPQRTNSIERTRTAVNPKEQYERSHRPFDFQTFLAHLRSKDADPVVRYIRSFLVSFSRQAGAMTPEQMVKAVRDFKLFISEQFATYEPFKLMDAVDRENSAEGIEKLIMNRLYEYTFAPEVKLRNSPLADDLKADDEYSAQLGKFGWVLAQHLDVDLDFGPKESREYLDYAAGELAKINKYRAPRDKIICILNSCKIIVSLLKLGQQETNADAFVPLLILVLLSGEARHLLSNLRYIERFRSEEWLNHGETSYYLSLLQGAIAFVQNVKFDDLTVSKKEYDANMEAWEADQRQRVSHSAAEPEAAEEPSLMPSSVLMASAELFSKSLSNFMSPSPTERSPLPETRRESVSEEQIESAAANLEEMIPALDKAIIRDIVIMNKANVEASLDMCLQLVEGN